MIVLSPECEILLDDQPTGCYIKQLSSRTVVHRPNNLRCWLPMPRLQYDFADAAGRAEFEADFRSMMEPQP